MEMNGQLHAPASFPPVPIGQEALSSVMSIPALGPTRAGIDMAEEREIAVTAKN